MNKTRLLMLANALEMRVPQDRFDLRGWRRNASAPEPDPHDDYLGEEISNERLVSDCGTTGCAVGWACSMREFNDEGLIWDVAPIYRHPNPRAVKIAGYAAVEMFFGIDGIQSQKLFSPDFYSPAERTDPLAVSNRIRAFVSNEGVL